MDEPSAAARPLPGLQGPRMEPVVHRPPAPGLLQPAASPPTPGLSANASSFGPSNTLVEHDLRDVLSEVWSRMKKVLGFTPPCHNGGFKNMQDRCECTQHFQGDFCEIVLCANNGTRVSQRNLAPHMDICSCPHSAFITGRHCEVVHCQNGGRDFGNGTCKCIDEWYTGQFCEFYSTNWLVVLGVPLVCLIFIVACCVLCRTDCFMTAPTHRRRNRRSHGEREPSATRQSDRPSHHHHSSSRHVSHHNQPQLPPHHHCIPMPPPSYNLGSVVDFKDIKPPPSYEQAISQCPALALPQTPHSTPTLQNNTSSTSTPSTTTPSTDLTSPVLPNQSISSCTVQNPNNSIK